MKVWKGFQVVPQSTKTKEFKRWFDGSKITNKEWNPLIMYHWTPNKDVNIFDKSKIWESTDSWMFWRWFYFTSDKKRAESYTKRKDLVWELKEVYLDVKHPFVINNQNDVDKFNKIYLKYSENVLEDYFKNWRKWSLEKMYAEAYEKWTKDLIAAWYDWVIDNIWWDFNQVIVFEPNQIKSATKNAWTFDKLNPDIYK